MKTFLNYLGQLRIYSLVDLILLLLAAGATIREFFGAIFLHIAFFAYLEAKHAHKERAEAPKWLSPLLVVAGAMLYQKWETIPFMACSCMYTKKNHGKFGLFSPFFRALQYLFLVAGVTSYSNYLPWLVFIVILARNTVGDARDVVKDKREGMETFPMILGLCRDIKYGHLVAMAVSTSIWWSFTGLPLYFFLGALLVEVATYNLTPR